MKSLEYQDCLECPINMEVIRNHNELISTKILEGMEESGERVTVHAELKRQALCLLTATAKDIPEIIEMDEEIVARYREYLKDLESGEALIIMTAEGSNHVGIYKLLPEPMH